MHEFPPEARSSRNSAETNTSERLKTSFEPPEATGCDFIYGAENIARFMGVSVRKIYYFMECKKSGASDIPINRIPAIGLCANRQALIDHLNGYRQAKPHQKT
jgi:hypothetical protein